MNRAVVLGLLTLLISPLVGCMDPNTTVTIEVSGTTTSEERESILEDAIVLTNSNSRSYTSGYMNDVYTIHLSPVEDVQAYADKIDFGTVTKVEGRTIYVDLNTQPAEPEVTDPAVPEEPEGEEPMS